MILQQQFPRFFYGTAWKEERTTELTLQALNCGFRAIDTANQRKHYFEQAVGDAVRTFLTAQNIKRADLFLQTKFTFARGQDHRKPYNENDGFTKQVADSFASSLLHLDTHYIDSYVLHGPYTGSGIGAEDLETWHAMETLVDNKQVKFLGVSNVSATQLAKLLSQVRIKPTFVQNRCYANTGWDKQVRRIAAEHDMHYQGFSLLTANRNELAHPFISQLCARYQKTPSQIIFRFCQQLNMICLNGTSNPVHIEEDFAINDFALTDDECRRIENLSC